MRTQRHQNMVDIKSVVRLTLRMMVKETVRVKVRDCLMTVKFRVKVTVTV